jgi:hypothetical protein
MTSAGICKGIHPCLPVVSGMIENQAYKFFDWRLTELTVRVVKASTLGFVVEFVVGSVQVLVASI